MIKGSKTFIPFFLKGRWNLGVLIETDKRPKYQKALQDSIYTALLNGPQSRPAASLLVSGHLRISYTGLQQ